MPDLNWPKALIITILVLGLFLEPIILSTPFQKGAFPGRYLLPEAVDRAEITPKRAAIR